MLTRSTIFCAISASLLLCGCYNLQTKDNLTPFPPAPVHVSDNNKPVVSFDRSNNTYVVTMTMMTNAVRNQLFVDEVLRWKRDNGIR